MLLYNGTLPNITIEPSIQCDSVIVSWYVLLKLTILKNDYRLIGRCNFLCARVTIEFIL